MHNQQNDKLHPNQLQFDDGDNRVTWVNVTDHPRKEFEMLVDIWPY